MSINFADDALVAELVDAADLKSVVRKDVPVRFRPSAPNKTPAFTAGFLFGCLNRLKQH